MRNGYKAIDFLSKPITTDGDAVTIPGIYDAIEGSLKAPLFKNLVVDDEEFKPFFPALALSSGDFTADLKTVYTEAKITNYKIVINDDDEVTVVSTECVCVTEDTEDTEVNE